MLDKQLEAKLDQGSKSQLDIMCIVLPQMENRNQTSIESYNYLCLLGNSNLFKI